MVRTDFFRRMTVGCLVGICGLGMMSLQADAKDIQIGVNVAAAQQLPLNRIDHSAWNGLLNKYVDESGMVHYAAWKQSAEDLQTLDGYLQLLSYSNSQGSREEKLAFWINAYNAVTIKGILNEYPTSSIRNHTAKLFGYNIWKNLKLIVGGKPISLDDMEHQVLRKMGEPRIHFAIVCASIGCPRLLNEAYIAERLDAQLTLNAKAFFADPSKFRFDATRSTFFISPILDWFGEDFGSSPGTQLQKISGWLPDITSQQAASTGRGKMAFMDYDWGLNDRK
ncbi:DUF547 domain-containing protein [Aureliella helgolandensis]|uniref:DUF547 domain-containing protein n=1 Tax=Aureliella helgolandensis TaxID=2527968 RepID=A0A518G4D1_9BACT|nr:DUF547 domain-containing protein [Aureliella helgolandensis]QDV23399.1 hypothetical protein Q31a_16970 [Aureliella helgolandensis]